MINAMFYLPGLAFVLSLSWPGLTFVFWPGLAVLFWLGSALQCVSLLQCDLVRAYAVAGANTYVTTLFCLV
jgi:hypothetical protein